MPIYAYKCSSCGHADDVLQKVSAEPLTVCPACGQSTYSKQVTAPQFQLKGSGWYVTDFRGGNGSGGGAKSDKPANDAQAGESAKSEGTAAAKAESAPASSSATASAPAASAAKD